eukprot:6175890-Pleurochrysis_carterae.AAC.1
MQHIDVIYLVKLFEKPADGAGRVETKMSRTGCSLFYQLRIPDIDESAGALVPDSLFGLKLVQASKQSTVEATHGAREQKLSASKPAGVRAKTILKSMSFIVAETLEVQSACTVKAVTLLGMKRRRWQWYFVNTLEEFSTEIKWLREHATVFNSEVATLAGQPLSTNI